MKRTFIYFFLMLAGTPLFAYDFSTPNSKGDTLYYNITSDSTVEVTYDVKVNKPTRFNFKGHIIIPADVSYGGKNYNVTKIGDMAFRYCPLIDSVTIPEGVETIGGWAFNNCTGLQWVSHLPVSLKELGESAFANCKLLEVCFSTQSCNIGSYAFGGCGQLQEVTLPRSHASLGTQCFYSDSNLCQVQMPDSMESIPASCFYYCIRLKGIVIPSGVKLIDVFAFYHCHSLVCCNFKTPFTLDSISVGAFTGDSSLLLMDLSQTKIRTLSRAVFEDCVSMKELKLPNTLKLVDFISVARTISLEFLVMPESVEFVHVGYCSHYMEHKQIFKSTTPPCWFRETSIYDTGFIKDTIYVPCGYEQVYRNANDKRWYIVENIKEVSIAEREIVLDSVCASEVLQKYGFYPDHSGTYFEKLSSGFACDSMAIFRISLATLPTLDDSSVNVEPDKEDTSVLWTWEGTGYAYNVYRDGDYITTVEQPYYLDTNIEFNVQYCYNFAPVNEKYCEGKWSTTNCYTMLSDTTGVAEHAAAHSLVIYPNPAKNVLFIGANEPSSVNGSINGTAYEITDVTGRMVLQGSYNAAEGIRVGNLAKGVYLLRLEGRYGRFVKE